MIWITLPPTPTLPPLWDVYYVYLAMAMATAMAVAVIRPKYAYGGRPPRKSAFYEKLCVEFILSISGLSRPQKWIRLEISVRMVVSGGLET